MQCHRLVLVTILVLCTSIVLQINAQDTPSPAIIINDEGGAVVVTGEVAYTNPFFTTGVAEPLIILEDQAGFIDRDRTFIFPVESQTLGQITSDFYTSPFTYSLSLPIEPQGTLRDVDNDVDVDTGVMVFAVAYWANTWGDPFLEQRDQQGGGWSTAYASTRTSTDPEQLREVIGGQLLVFAPEADQGFPSGFGDDGLLFTDDDPIVMLPIGYTMVDLDTEPFTFDRSREPRLDLYEPQSAALVDFSGLSFTDAFDAMIDKFKREYAFTEYKGLDWDVISVKYRPFFEEADANSDSQLYFNTLAEVIWSVPDGHVNLGPLDPFTDIFFSQYGRGIGLIVRTTSDNRVYATYVAPNSDAAANGFTLGTEIVSVNDQPINDYIDAVVPFAETTSTPHNRRLAQERWAFRFPEDSTEVAITFRPDENSDVQTVMLPVVEEFDSYFAAFSTGAGSNGYELPVEYNLLPDGYVYVRINTFFDDRSLSIRLWERMIREMNGQDAPGLIIDMRQNGGGSGFLADQMSAYFFQESLVIGRRASYSPDIDAFFFDPASDTELLLPPAELRYNGPIVVLISPDCASACERFAYNLTLEDRATVIGHFPTAGLGGGVEDFRMPLGITVRMTVTRSVDANGDIHIEGLGIPPTIPVPVTVESLFSDRDVLLNEAIRFLNN